VDDVIKIGKDDYPLVNEIFSNFSCYDALQFEISAIKKVLDHIRELYITEINNSKYSETDLTQRLARFLRIMLMMKYCHLAETLGATALAFLNTKIKGSFISYSKDEERRKILESLSAYDVGDVVNFYRDISERNNSYVADFMGYPPLLLQNTENKELLDTSCNTVRHLVGIIGNRFRNLTAIYNAYKHGYRVIPHMVNSSEAILFMKDNGEPEIFVIGANDIDKILEFSNYCRSILEDIFKNYKTMMEIDYEGRKSINVRLYRRNEDSFKQISLNLTYGSREDKVKVIHEEEKNVLKKIHDIEHFSGKWVLVDLDEQSILFSDRDMKKVMEYYHDSHNDHRKTIRRLTQNFLKGLK